MQRKQNRPSYSQLIFVTILIISPLLFTSCSDHEAVNIAKSDLQLTRKLPEKQLTFRDVRPILEKRCIVCHGCYDAPCQLKLSSYEGVNRGANTLKVYDKGRFNWQQPTRLFIDANTTNAWRHMSFFPVLNETSDHSAENNLKQALLYQMLNLKKQHPLPEEGMLPETLDISIDRKQVCSTLDTFTSFSNDHPLWGMPYALPALTDSEYNLLVTWLAQGAKKSPALDLSEHSASQVKQWEKFFNSTGNKPQLVSRYIYEHLVLAHIHFKGAPAHEFFRLVRSRTPSGEVIEEIPTVRPYDDPEGTFYYRLRPYTASIVDKNHIVYELSDARMQRYRDLFFQENYHVDKLPPYNAGEASGFFERNIVKLKKLFGLYNAQLSTPFKTFAAIPPKARYQFLLDDARFFINGFIKGPVCRGQSALSSIEDHYWVFFMKPENPSSGYKQHGLDSPFLEKIDQYLHLPTELADTNRLFTAWIKYWPLEQRYMRAKIDYYQQQNMPVLPIDQALEDFIWNGKQNNGNSPNAALTVFRHFDSASVHYGLLGDEPETAWILDYPIFERLHYLLVAGFNVFGTLGHQASARLYMDFLRIEGEDNFLYFLPIRERKLRYQQWHEIDRKTTPEQNPSTQVWLKIHSVSGYQSNHPQHELYQRLSQYIPSVAGKSTDLNRCNREDCFTLKSDHAMQRLANLHGEKLQIFPEVTYIRVRNAKPGQRDMAYTVIRNKSYRQDTFAKENDQDRPQDRKSDTLTIVKGLAGSYPNFFFDLSIQQLETFVDSCENLRNKTDYERLVSLYGIRRTNPLFWQVADWFQQRHTEEQPIEGGILDLSRYKNR